MTSILLVASDSTVRSRLARREKGPELDAHLERSALAAVELQLVAASGTIRVATDERTVTQIADRIIEIAGWY